MKVVTAQEMQQLDQLAIEEYGISGLVLMENAGQAIVRKATEVLDDQLSPKVVIVAGTGNNGGDGFVVARLLNNLGWEVEVFLIGSEEAVSGDAEINLNILSKLDIAVQELESQEQFHDLVQAMEAADLVVDGILGTGIKGELRGILPQIIDLINDDQTPVLAIDIPSGLNADNGRLHGRAVEANWTVTFGLPKIGLLLYPGCEHAGKLEIADISLPQLAVDNQEFKRKLITNELAQDLLPYRQRCGHKGTFGRVVVIAGSEGMTGAAKLSSLATLKSGAGLVTLGLPRSLNSILEEKLTEVMTKPLPETRKSCLSLNALSGIKKLSQPADVMAIGPGLSQGEEMTYILHDILTEIQIPLIIDADGLNAIQDLDLLRDREEATVLTPHPGELARLINRPIAEIEQNRVEIAQEVAVDLGVTVVLKGATTVVATADGQTYINSTGNSGLASAGSGDVLTGIITGLIGQGLDDWQAAVLGVYLHGLAADIKLESETVHTLIASDIIAGLPQAFKTLEEG
ncbi:MAG: NAD(P)H-hydrate dehydratase [Bacillota bacterium]